VLSVGVLVVGSEGAGARAAIEASKYTDDVMIVTKGKFGQSGATLTAGADIDVDSASVKRLFDMPGDDRDSPDIFMEDIIKEGKYLNNQSLVEVHVQDAPARVKELVDWGMGITFLLHAPGHTYPRGVYTSGKEMVKALKGEVLRRKTIKVMEHTMVTDLLSREGEVVGVLALDLFRGEFFPIQARAIVLATGGGMQVFPVQTAPEELTGDGQAMAWRAGAHLVDMEMTQFLPCVFISPPMWKGLAFPFMLGPMGGLDTWLLNKYGNRYMKDWDPERMERTTRDVLSRALATEVIKGRGSPNGGTWLSLAHLPYNIIDYLAEWYAKPYLKPDWKYKAFDFRELMEDVKKGYAIEVGVASHFFMGGIQINPCCETTLPGLYAAGEVAGGTHGANRLSGNACTSIVVQGAIAGRVAAERAKKGRVPEPDPVQVKQMAEQWEGPLHNEGGPRPFEVKKHIQQTAWKNAGVMRSGALLQEALQEARRLKDEDLPRLSCGAREREYNREWIEAIQAWNTTFLLEAISSCALLREESRGAHNRIDFPTIDNNRWLQNIHIRNAGGAQETYLTPVVKTKVPLPGGEES
jgi:succinate dehydrogenase/fumarate reductase flavoprotein subunit